MISYLRRIAAALGLGLGLGTVSGLAVAGLAVSGLGWVGLGVSPALAQVSFGPAITVNDKVITGYELDQRERMLRLFRAPGDPRRLAREQLIEERLKQDAAEAMGLSVPPEAVAAGMEEFAARADLTAEQFLSALQGGGVAEETFRDFVRNGVMWRELVRARFAGRVEVTEADIDRALASVSGSSNLRVLLSEIIMPAPPPEAAAVMARAERISQITSVDAFSAEARRHSATSSRERGGRLDWLPLSQLPPALQPIVLGLAPGQVTPPLPLDGAVALFQLRALEETGFQAPEIAAIEYAEYFIDGGRSDAALAEAARLRARLDNCDDLYGVNKGQPDERLNRLTRSPADIPQDVAMELAKLDAGEVSTALTRNDGQTLVLLMMCGRTTAMAEDQDRERLRLRLQNQRLESLANAYLAQLMADAHIIE